MMPRQAEKGSALFIILIAVVLFAALSFSIAQMLRDGNPATIAEEKSRLYAEEILSYGRTMRQAAQNMKISHGCADMDISVEDTGLPNGYIHSPVTSDGCKLFDPEGGGVTYQKPVAAWLAQISPTPALQGNWYFPANTCVPGTGTAAAGAGCNSDSANNEAIIAVLPYIQKQVCLQVNKLLGIANPGGNPPAETANAWPGGSPYYNGGQADGERLDQAGKMAGCFEGAAASTPTPGTYHFFQILVAR